ncbi:hypothetical protein N7491_006201 [Penicillium cf. griseofulvum]|uniref:Uncharacterized protein n=1 Tax=Penicillium cf. griseofulvum TaxID=2972120 RepID=A0A9W9IXN6_9EURO|nr:hypothetical protein N7472_010769 [Penicillium cf. griseofulvum]KAJ5429185.1 hypothetical protein N7491_006201 [Penicillium cf. griseofulvum]KAJ5437023.1 hypothetical protein N7445_007908 [Penicillium cf. griseofulvum]
MKSILLLLAAYAVTLVSAYSNYGAYERVFYWYAYQVDADVHNGVPQIIAPACKGAKKRCNFAEFIAYIEKEKAGVKPTGFTDDMPVDVRAQKLFDQQFTGTYEGTRIIQGQSDDAQVVTRLMKEIGTKFRKEAFMQQAEEKSQVNLSQMRTAIKRVHFLRGVEYSNDFKQGLKDNGISVRTKKKQFRYKLDEFADFVDVKGTRVANPKVTDAEWAELLKKLYKKPAAGQEGSGSKLGIHAALYLSVKETMENIIVRPCKS